MVIDGSATIAELLAAACGLLAHSAGQAARLESELLIAHALDKPRTHLIAWPDKQLSQEQCSRALSLIERRRQGEPIAYITGEREFWSLSLQVTPDTLIPRPDTECLVARALELLTDIDSPRVADLGTGSGAIALAIARERHDCQVTATDYSEKSLAVAQSNAARLGLKNIQFVQGDWCQALAQDARFDLIISNPPYIAHDDPHLQQGDLRFEPTRALVSGEDGLDDIRRIAPQAKHHLAHRGVLLIEHGYAQGSGVRQILESHGYQDIRTLPDWEQRERLTEGFTGL